ncbi:MAG TPA: hypothetical protein VFJ58_09290 [Armatimonadota bacterium]|nr:hypothetical protein [Armatimonadota bacterium]
MKSALFSRRTAIKRLALAAAGAVGMAAPSLASAEPAAAPATVPVVPPVPVPPVPAPKPAPPPTPAQLEFTAMPAPENASGGHGGDLSAVTNAINGPGLYIGNEFKGWTDVQRQLAFASAARWGFTFVCPKVGGYGKTWHQDTQQLESWKAAAEIEGVKLAPFIYTIPDTAVADGAIAAAVANTCGIIVVDMEDEWGTTEANHVYQGVPMAQFGDRYRKDAARLPVIVTGYGDPITRFGTPGWPFLEMQTWADAYSPQFYYGVWSRFYNGGPESAIDWGAGECSTAFHASFPIVPSVSIYSAWSKSGVMSPYDLNTGKQRLQHWSGPVFWWEYTGMTDALATIIA